MNTRGSRFAGLALLVLFQACGGAMRVTTSNPQPVRRFAYVAHAIFGVFVHSIDDGTGALTLVSSTGAVGLSALDVAVDRATRFAYSADCMNHVVHLFAINSATGELTTNGPDVPAGICPQDIVIHPTGKFLYVLASGFAAGTDPNLQDLIVFSIDATTGALGLVSDMQVGIGKIVGHLAIEPAGRFAFFTNLPGLFAFSIDQSSGVPAPVASPPNVAGDSPFGLSADPSGKFLYVVNPSSNDLYTLSINSGTGVLSELARTTVGNHPTDVVVDPMGRFVYITNNLSNSVSAFLINSATGALTPAAGSPYAAGSFPYSLAIDPSGKFLLVNNSASMDISVYTIDATTGALRQVPGSPFAQEARPEAVVIVQVR
jgi:6-phosphogluconolactonase (cycloisomerase 2 family)